MKRTFQTTVAGSAFALFAATALTGIASASADTGSLDSGSLGSLTLGSLAPEFESPYTLADAPECTEENYFGEPHNMWEINWESQYTDQHHTGLDSQSYGGLAYIDGQYADETPAETLARIKAYDENPEHSQNFHWWGPTRDMVSDGAELTLGFADGDVVLGEVMVGSDKCPSVRWTHFPAEGGPETTTPDAFPSEAPVPTKPAVPSDSEDTDSSAQGSLGSLFGA